MLRFKGFADNKKNIKKHKFDLLILLSFFPFLVSFFKFHLQRSCSLFPHHAHPFSPYGQSLPALPSSFSIYSSSLSSHPHLPASVGQSLMVVESTGCCSVFLWLTDLLTLPKIRGNTGSVLRSCVLSLNRKKRKKNFLHSTQSINNTLPWELQLVYIGSTHTYTHRVGFFFLPTPVHKISNSFVGRADLPTCRQEHISWVPPRASLLTRVIFTV